MGSEMCIRDSVQMAISRTREYSADRRGAEIAGNPIWLASALAKIASAAGRTVNVDAERNPATAHMFIINPLNGQRMDNLFSTHPDTNNRIAALKAQAAEMQPAAGGSGRFASTAQQGGFLDEGRRRGPWSGGSNSGGGRRGPWG